MPLHFREPFAVFIFVARVSLLISTLVSKYGGMYEAERELGNVEAIKRVFVDFQQHLYSEKVA